MNSIKVRVPATSANLGAGFDTLGISLSIYNYFKATEIENGLVFEGCKEEFKTEENLVYKSIKYVFDKVGFVYEKGLKIEFETNIKDSSGLGSSATCIVCGVIIGAKILEENNIFLSKDDLIKLAIEIEGHGDNVVPAMLGGLTIFMHSENGDMFRKTFVSDKLKFAIITSDLEKESTNKLRGILKREVSLEDATFNISHALMSFLALQNGDDVLLKESMKDKIHEVYRKAYIEDFDEIYEKAILYNAISLNISGSGPSLILIYNENFLEQQFLEFLKTLNNNWCFTKCFVDLEGALIEED